MTIKLPNFNKMYDYETNYHLTMTGERMGKLLSHYEILKKCINVPGEIVECGVFKGTSLTRFAIMRDLLGTNKSAKIIGFDVFSDKFPNTNYKEDKKIRSDWIKKAGGSSISKKQIIKVFKKLGISNYEIINGDILKTLPAYIKKKPKFISIKMNSGDVCFFNSYIPHRSSKNISNKKRAQLYINYSNKKNGQLREIYFKEKRQNYPPNNERIKNKVYSYKI